MNESLANEQKSHNNLKSDQFRYQSSIFLWFSKKYVLLFIGLLNVSHWFLRYLGSAEIIDS